MWARLSTWIMKLFGFAEADASKLEKEVVGMFHYTIRRMGSIVGGVIANSEQEALDAVAKANGFKDFAEELLKLKMRRDHYTVEERPKDSI